MTPLGSPEPQDPRLRRLAEALRRLPPPPTETDRARERYRDGTLTDSDLDLLDIGGLEEVPWKLVSLSEPFRRVRDAGFLVPVRTKFGDVVGLLLSYRPDETPPSYLIERISAGLQPRRTDDEELIADHNCYVVTVRVIGGTDGMRFREEMAAGRYRQEPGRSRRHPGYELCPLDCPGQRAVHYCLCSSRGWNPPKPPDQEVPPPG